MGIKKIMEKYNYFEEMFSGALLAIGLAISFYGVIMRYVMNSPEPWVDEIFKYFVIWGTMIGFAVSLRHQHHIKVDALYGMLPQNMKRYMDVLSNGIGLLFCVLFTLWSVQLVMINIKSGQVSMDVGIPMWVVYLIVPLAGVLFGLRFLESIYLAITNQSPELQETEAERIAKL